eukprot:GHVQ01009158.1.p1 GENE.GHVQ01009158.1~~GHVQ01009158.1.p1  ORF type:complete len:554 (+),score=58.34 GHVQ01009158.1:240-1664(+)
MKKNVRFDWSDQCQRAFECLKEEVGKVVMLSPPRGTGAFVIVCDASDVGIGSALLQWQEGEIALLEMASKRLSTAERNWDVREKEAFAVKWSVQRYSDYVRAGRVFVLTDHEALKWMKNSTAGKVQRWSLYLQQFDICICHIAGEHNVIADWLSRSCEDDDGETAEKEVDEMTLPVCLAEEEDKETRVENRCEWPPYVPNVDDFMKAYALMRDQEKRVVREAPDGFWYELRSGCLYVPELLRETVAYWFHASRYGGHAGVNKTVRRMKKWVWWKGMSQYMQAYISGCLICRRQQRPEPVRLLKNVLVKPLPLQMVSCDLVGPRVVQGQEFHYCVIIDHASRFIVAKVCGTSSADVITLFKDAWLSVFHVPNAVLTDRGPCFRHEFQRFVTGEMRAYHVYTSPYYPQGNAINEASHVPLEKSISAEVMIGGSNPVEALCNSVLVHNACPHVSTGISPFGFLFGFEPLLPGSARPK